MPLQMRRVWTFPTGDTFDAEPISNFVRKYLAASKVSIDPFARNKRWATYTNDLNPDTKAEYHMEAAEFLKMLADKRVKADLAIMDPPYSSRQAKELYDGMGIKITTYHTNHWVYWQEERQLIGELVQPGGWVLSFGWNSIGMGKERGFELQELLLCCHGGAHNDTICIAEQKVQYRLDDMWKED